VKATVAAALTAAALVVPAADAKFRLSVVVEPQRPTAGVPARVVMRSHVDLPSAHAIRLFAVGPWRRNGGQGYFEVRLARRSPRVLTGRARFPYAGRWHLNAPSPPVDLWVTVRRRPG
jgi:hypothetical protein